MLNIYLQWFNDSAEDIRSCCDKALKTLQAHYGWQVRNMTRPSHCRTNTSTLEDTQSSFDFGKNLFVV